MQLPGHFSVNDGWYFWRPDRCMLGHHLYGRHFSLRKRQENIGGKHKKGSTTVIGKWPVSKTKEMRVRKDKNWMARNDHWGRKNFNGCRETQRNTRLASSNYYRKTSSRLLRNRKLLSKIYTTLFRDRKTIKRTVEERSDLRIDTRMSKVVWRTEETLHWRTCPRNARPHQAIPNRMWCFQICNRSGLNSVGFEWRPTPLRVYFQNVLPDGAKLRDLRQRINGNYSSLRRMVTLHPRFPPQDNNTFGS